MHDCVVISVQQADEHRERYMVWIAGIYPDSTGKRPFCLQLQAI